MIDQKQVELLVRARAQGQGNITAMTKEVDKLKSAIEDQAAAAKRGEGSIDDLKASLIQLENVEKQLTASGRLVKQFEATAAGIEKTETRIRGSASAYAELEQKIAKAGKATETQANRLIKLQATQDAGNKTLATQRVALEYYGKALEEAGLNAGDLVASQARIAAAMQSTAIATARAQQAVQTYSADMRAASEARKAQAKVEKDAADAQAAVDAQRAAAAAKINAQQKEQQRLATAFETTRNVVARKNAADEAAAVNARKAALDKAQADELAMAKSTAEQKQRIAEQTAKLVAFAQKKNFNDQAAATVRDTGLAGAADDAEKAARGYTTLARASGDLAPRILSVKDALGAIANPAAQTRSTLNGVETELKTLGAAIESIKGPVKDYKEQFNQLNAAQKALSSQAGLIDTFRQQTAELQRSRASFVAARAEVTKYAAEVRKGGESGASFVNSLNQAQSAAARAATALQNQLSATRGARDSLREAGIAANDLAGAEARLSSAAGSAVNSMRSLNEAYDRHGESVGRAAKSGGLFNDEGRTTLSLAQRIRGEILAMAAAYVGLQGAIGLASGSLEAYNARSAVRNQLALSAGNDEKAIDAEYAYVKGQADRIGLELSSAAKGYAKFAAAQKLAGKDEGQYKFIFESFSEVGRVANLTTDELNGVFLALEQITSKGSIQAEELTGQLGERLPGLFEVAQKALKDQFPDLRKAMKEGQVGAEALVKIAAEYRKVVGDRLPTAIQSLSANQARLNTEVENFKLTIADTGFAEGFNQFAKQLAEFLRSDDGTRLATSISTGFTALLDTFMVLLKNLDEVKTVLTVIVTLVATNAFANIVLNFGKMAAAASVATVELTAMQKALVLIQRSILLVSAAVIGFEIGEYLNKFQTVRAVGISVVTGLLELFTRLKYGVQIVFEALPNFAYDAMAAMVNLVTLGVRQMLGVFGKLAGAVGLETIESGIKKAVDAMTVGYKGFTKKAFDLNKQMKADIDGIRSIAGDMFDDLIKGDQTVKGIKPVAKSTPQPPDGKGKPKGPSEADIKKRETMIEAITKALETLDAKIDKTEKKNLSAQLTAIDSEYEGLYRKIIALAKLDPKQAVAFQNQLDKKLADLKMQTTKNFNDALLKEEQALQNKLEAVDAKAGLKNKQDLQARQDAIALSYADTYREIEAFRKTLADNGRDTGPADEQKRRLDAGVAQLKNLEAQKFAQEQLKDMEQAVTQQVGLRQQLLTTVTDQQKAGLIGEAQAMSQINDINERMVPAITAAAGAAAEFAAAHNEAFDHPEEQEVFIAKMVSLRAATAATIGQFSALDKTITSSLTTNALDAFTGITDALGQMVAGTLSVGEGFKAIGASIANFFAGFLMDIGKAIAKQLILNALLQAVGGPGGGGGLGNALVSMGASVFHEGGVVGTPGGRRRQVDPSWFTNAPRYHSGGVPGMAPDEYATILQKNEEVLTADSPRNIMNGGLVPSGGSAPVVNNKIINMIDSASVVSEGLATAAGGKAIINFIRANKRDIKTVLGG